MPSEYRWVKFFDLNLTMSRGDADAPEMIDIMKDLEKAVAENDGCLVPYHNGTYSMSVAEVNIDENLGWATILINSCDSKHPEAVYGHLKSKKQRHFPKEEDEGSVFSAHIFISLEKNKDTYLFILEEATFLSRTTITPYLTYLFRHYCSKEFQHSENEKPFNAYPKFELHGHVSNAMKDSLRTGAVRQVSFIEKKKNTKFDDGGYYQEEEVITRITIRKKRKSKKIIPSLEILNRLMGQRGANQVVRVAFRSDKGKEQTVEVPQGTSSWEDANVVKMEQLDVVKSSKSCESSIHSQLLTKLIELLKQQEEKEGLEQDNAA